MRLTRLILPMMCVTGTIACGDQSTPILDTEPAGNSSSDSIINGFVASDELVDRQGALFASADGFRFGFVCGATYIGESDDGNGNRSNWVMTAAHCVDGSVAALIVGFGRDRLSEYTFADTVEVEAIAIAPGYNPAFVSRNDIALLRVSGRPNAIVSTLANAETDAAVNETVQISGFGATQSSNGSDILLRADGSVIDTNSCGGFFGPIVDGSVICVLDSDTTAQGACNGDSGGPMFRSDLTQVGLTSFGSLGCSTDAPSVYTRISEFRSWIQSVSGI